MKKRDYALISTGEPNDFENSILHFLRDWPGEKPPKSYVIQAIPEHGDVEEAGAVVYTWRATVDDMLRAKGHLELQIQHEALLENLGTYFQVAREEGILHCQFDPASGSDQIDNADDQDAEGGGDT